MKLAVAFVAFALAASAAGFDGQWNAELRAGGKKAAPARPTSFSLNLKTQENGQVTGTVAVPGKKKALQQPIQNAKLDGNRLTFTTARTGKNGSVTFSWQLTVDGDQMTGTRTREGARRGVTFKARKAG